jgi:hypothetical protein
MQNVVRIYQFISGTINTIILANNVKSYSDFCYSSYARFRCDVYLEGGDCLVCLRHVKLKKAGVINENSGF